MQKTRGSLSRVFQGNGTNISTQIIGPPLLEEAQDGIADADHGRAVEHGVGTWAASIAAISPRSRMSRLAVREKSRSTGIHYGLSVLATRSPLLLPR